MMTELQDFIQSMFNEKVKKRKGNLQKSRCFVLADANNLFV